MKVKKIVGFSLKPLRCRDPALPPLKAIRTLDHFPTESTHVHYYQKGLSPADGTQEALLVHIRDGGKPFLCLYDIEEAFDSVEIPILLKQLYSIGINGKLWRLLNHW